MLLRDLIRRLIPEGGNVGSTSKDWQGVPGDYKANEIDLLVHKRSFIVPLLDKLLHNIDNKFTAMFKKPLWSQQLLASRQFLSGSSLHLFNTTGISDELFVAKKPRIGDIDTQCNVELKPEIQQFLQANIGAEFGDARLMGYKPSPGSKQFITLFQFQDPPITVQVDLELGKYDTQTNEPDAWFKFSHSSDWVDINAGIKGVFHKFLYQALSGIARPASFYKGSDHGLGSNAQPMAYIAKLQGRGKKRGIVISDEPKSVSLLTFSVSSDAGGGVRYRYKPYIDPATNQPMRINGIPVLEKVESADSTYNQNLDAQFELFFGHAPDSNESRLQQSFIGTLDLVNVRAAELATEVGSPALAHEIKKRVVDSFLFLCFGSGDQMLTAGDPERDAKIKFVAIDVMLDKLDVPEMRAKAVEMAAAHAEEYHGVTAYKKANPEDPHPLASWKKLQKGEAEEIPVDT